MSRHPLVTLAIALALATAACGDATGPASTHAIVQTDGRGTRLSGAGEHVASAAFWSPDQQWVYYPAFSDSDGSIHLRRVPSAGGEAADVDLDGYGVLGYWNGGLWNIAPAADGSAYALVWASDSVPPTEVLRAMPGASPERIPALDGAWGIGLAPGGRHLVYGLPQSTGDAIVRLMSYDLTDKTTVGLGTGHALAFSPDGTDVLYLAGVGIYERADLATGARQPVYLGLGSDQPEWIAWTEQGIQAVFGRYDQGAHRTAYFVRDVSAGTTTHFYDQGFDAVLRAVALSPTGSRLAITAWDCLHATSVVTCDSSVEALYAIGVPSGAETWIATVHDADIRGVEFSPDGRRVAYAIGDELYVSQVPAQ